MIVSNSDLTYAVYRGGHLNRGDLDIYKNLDITPVGFGPRVEQFNGLDIGQDLRKLLDFDIVDTPELFWHETAWLLHNHPNVIVTVFEQIPYLNPTPGPDTLNLAKFVVCRSVHAAITAMVFHGVKQDKVKVIYPGVDTDRFTVDPQPRERTTIGCVAKLFHRKGVWDLLNAAVLMHASGHDIALKFAGDGDQRDALESIAGTFDMDISFLGNIPHEEMPAFYNTLDVLVLPSLPTDHWVEQFGLCMIEAMACGVPVVASGQTGAVEMSGMPDNAGAVSIYPPGMYTQLCSSIVNCLDMDHDPELIREFCVNNFSHHKKEEEYMDLIDQLYS